VIDHITEFSLTALREIAKGPRPKVNKRMSK
jgi:hypothetical protein